MFLQKSKIQTVGDGRIIFFSVISFQNIFIYALFQKMVNISFKHFFKNVIVML